MDGFVMFVLALVLAAEFVNGWTDAPNSIATVVSTRVLSPGQALAMASVLNILGAMSGTAVAATIGKGIIKADVVNIGTVAAAMVAIVFWSTLAWAYGLPTSESHALIAGLSGAGLATAGWGALIWDGWQKVLIGLLISTFLGFLGGLTLTLAIYWIFRRQRPGGVRRLFGRLQLASAAFMAFSHGSNDGQKFIGAFTLTLVLGGLLPRFEVPFWVILLCARTMGIGTAVGGWRIRSRDGGRQRDRAGLPSRHPGQHHPHDQHVDHGRRRDTPLVGGAIGRRTRDRDRLDPDVPGLRSDRVARHEGIPVLPLSTR